VPFSLPCVHHRRKLGSLLQPSCSQAMSLLLLLLLLLLHADSV
jgi:hypothetical protein